MDFVKREDQNLVEDETYKAYTEVVSILCLACSYNFFTPFYLLLDVCL